LVFWHTSKHSRPSQKRLNEDLERFNKYCETWKLKVNYSNTAYSIFTKNNKVAKQNIMLSLNGNIIQKEDNPTYLGVTMDRQLSLNKHIQNLREKSMKRLKIVKRLASTTWGAEKNHTKTDIHWICTLRNGIQPSSPNNLQQNYTEHFR
jgi:hypothetical protein